MDKSKSEKLKEVLNQTLSSEEIERKLKEERKQASEKKAIKQELENQENEPHIKEALENLETPIERENHAHEHVKQEKEESPLNKKVEIPNVRDKKKESRNLNIALYLVMIIAILLLAIAIYLFTKSEFKSPETKQAANIEKNIKETKQEITQKPIVEKKEEKQEIKIEPTEEVKKQVEEKLNTIEKKEVPAKAIEKVQTVKAEKVEEKKEAIVKAVEEKVEKTVEPKQKVITKVVNFDKESFKEYYNSSKYNSLKCYSFKAGDVFPDRTCKADLQKFLKANKNAIRFEIIPVIAEDDYIVFKQLDSNIKELEKNYQNRIKEYMYRGLSRERVLETSWQIKEILGEDTILTPTNYYVKSKKNNKGVIIKAYY